MTYKGIIRGKMIELEERLPYPEGQPVMISVQPVVAKLHPGSPAAIRQAMHEPPHLQWADVDALERVITEGQLPVHPEGAFDQSATR